MTTIKNAATGQPAGKTAPRPAATPQKAARMSLANVREETGPAPLRDVIYGADGVGKTSFAADAPAPIFLPGPDWPRRLKVARFPQASCWADVLASIEELRTQKHGYQTFVLDAVDSIEAMVWRDVSAKHNVPTIEDVGGGFKKGYGAALAWWRTLTEKLTDLQRLRGMHVIIITHARAATFKNPQGEDYIRWTMNLDPQAADLLRQWADDVLFMSFERRVVKAGKHAKPKGQGGQVRMIYTTWHAAYDAKNRANLDPVMDMDFSAYYAAVMGGGTDLAAVRAEIVEGIARLDAQPQPYGKVTVGAAAGMLLTAAGDDAVKLAKLANWVRGKIDALPDVAEEPLPGATPEAPPPADAPPDLTDAEVEALPEESEGIADLFTGDEEPVGMIIDETRDDPEAPPLGATPPTEIHEPAAPVTEPEKPAPVAPKKPPVKLGKGS